MHASTKQLALCDVNFSGSEQKVSTISGSLNTGDSFSSEALAMMIKSVFLASNSDIKLSWLTRRSYAQIHVQIPVVDPNKGIHCLNLVEFDLNFDV